MTAEFLATESFAAASPEQRLERIHREFAVLLEVNRAVVSHLRRDDLFGTLAACLQKLLPTQRFGIELPFEGDKLRGHLLTPSGDSFEPTQPHVLPANGTACNWVIQNRQWLIGASCDELRERFPTTFAVMRREGMESVVAIPLVTGERCSGALFCMAAGRNAYADLRREFLEQVTAAVAVAVDNVLAHEEVQRLSDQLAAENAYLQDEIRSEHNFEEIVGNSAALRDVLTQVERVAATDSTVLLLGETGTGKELLARAVHNRSRRRERPLVKVNCGAIAAGLVESELFGHVRGAFTGASEARDGRFKLADGGTIFLDEVGELTPEAQVKLLRILQEREFEPIGSSASIKVDVRVIAATNRDLNACVAQGKFRGDLYYRLNVFPIHAPPLRERREDIRLLVGFFLQDLAKKMGKPVKRVPEVVMEQLVRYDWPGNIRELHNVIEHAVILSTDNALFLPGSFGALVPQVASSATSPHRLAAPPAGAGAQALEDVERHHIESTLRAVGWKIEGDHGAAKVLGLNPSTLRSRMRKLGIRR